MTLQSLMKGKRRLLISLIESKIPAFSLESKEDSGLFCILSKIVFWNKRLNTEFVTTVYPKVYVPHLPWKEDDHFGAFSVLAHEYVHLKDRERLKFFFNLLYLSPQVFSLLSLFSLVHSSWWLLCLLFLMPIPSPGRAWLEYRGYRCNMAIWYWLGDEKIDFDWIIGQFTGSSYYWMFPFPGFLTKMLERDYQRLKAGDVPDELLEIQSLLSE